MTEPTDQGDLEVAVEPPDYGFVPEGDARLRCFIFECMANADIDGRIFIENAQAAFEWIRDGKVPPKEAHAKKRPAALVAT